jgi:Fic family protein
MKNTSFFFNVPVFHGRSLPEPGIIVGYGAIIEKLQLPIPLPQKLALIGEKVRGSETQNWLIFGNSYKPKDSLYHYLVFSLKYEGVDLLFFRFLFKTLNESEVIDLISIEPSGQYSRRIWFLYEWLMNRKLDIPDLGFKNYVPLLDEKLQYTIPGSRSSRHRIINNLPGTSGFCPLVRKTPKLDAYIQSDLSGKNRSFLSTVHLDLLQRTSAFLLLKDSKASFTIEGESLLNQRLHRWGQAIGQAGAKPLDKNEMLRLQELVINSRHIDMGFRKTGGFIGDHDRDTNVPLPDHISAKWEDLDELLDSYIKTGKLLEKAELDAVLTAALLAFGFVFIHPFVDGNGRIHRYIIHHVLARKGFCKLGIIFPVSSSILEKITEYRQILESYSYPLLDFIEWEPTPDHNVKVLNETIDFYRYYDATTQAEFLFDCVQDTMERIIPVEIQWLQNFDAFKLEVDSQLGLTDKQIKLLVNFLDQGKGILSNRARKKEFPTLNSKEIDFLQASYKEIFLSD